MHISELDTPCIVIDLDRMERNLARVADYARQHDLRLRPHTKTHKIVHLAKQQLALGAAGLTVAKVGEAEVMAAAAPAELLVAFPVIGAQKLARLVEVARRVSVLVALDSLIAAEQLSTAASSAQVTIAVLLEVDPGSGRVGVSATDACSLASRIAKLPGLRFDGITCYPGHIKRIDEHTPPLLRKLDEMFSQLRQDLERAGLACRIVSGGSTPALFHSHLVNAWNEIRPGTYIFNDRNTVACGACTLDDCAAYLLTTIISTSVPGQFVMDGGSKTFSSDRLSTGEPDAGYGYVMEAPEAHFERMNEEHGMVLLPNASSRFSAGDRVRVIPNHICVAMNLHNSVYGVRGDQVEAHWPVDARGKLQ